MSTEENEAVVRRFLEQSLGGGGDPEPADEPLDPDLVRYDPYIEAGEVRGTRTAKGNIAWFHDALRDLSCTVEDHSLHVLVRARNAGQMVIPGPGHRQQYCALTHTMRCPAVYARRLVR